MKRIISYLVLLLLTTSCSYHIVRTGYQVSKSDYKNCDIVIKKQMIISDSLQKVGEIRLGETGFTVICSEAEAIEVLKNEGCALGAEIINITEEKRPDLWSSCYRCKAEFFKYSGKKAIVQSDSDYNVVDVNKRVSKDRGRNTAIGITAVAIGFLLGLLMF